MPRYVLCKFRPGDSRSYTYLLDGHDVAIGDKVKVADNRSDGWKIVTVDGFTDDEPPFACKPILRKEDPKPDAMPDLVEAAEDWSRDIDPEELF